MPKTVDQFREDFPEFGNQSTYPDPLVQFWLDQAYGDLNVDRFGDRIDLAAELFTAHMVTIGARNQAAASQGNIPGASSGLVTSRSVDKVSVSYDASLLGEAGAGFWNMSTYGMRFWWLLRQRCLGPVYRAPVNTRHLL